MLNDFFITRDVIGYLESFIRDRHLNLPALNAQLTSLSLKQSMSFEQWWALLEELERLHPIPALGLEIGRNMRAQDCGLLGYLFKTSRNLGDALKCFNRFQGLIYAGSEAKLVFDKQTVTLYWEPDYGYSSQTSDALLIAAMISIIRDLIAPEALNLKSVYFTQSIPSAELGLYDQFFKCDIKDCQSKLSIQLLVEDLGINIPHVDDNLNRILGQQAENLLAHLPESDTFLASLRNTVLRCLNEGNADAVQVAREMGLSERTLHRRLKAKGRVYRNVLKEIRKSMSVNYLNDPKLTLPEIALLLGYSEQSTFSRAFKQWYGMPPLKYQKNHCDTVS